MNVDLLFVDSGGYETSRDEDYSSVRESEPVKEPWDEENYRVIMESWPETISAAFVSYDYWRTRLPLSEQIVKAKKLFRNCRDHVQVFLLKPETTDQNTLESALRSVVASIEQLSGFDIIGVTEKELGSSMIQRMVAVARLRRAMDDASLAAPIHVFGALDPIAVCLYFVAGAEIFDGLTWIRYGYSDGRCVYVQNHGIVNFGLYERDEQIQLRTIQQNIYQLQHLENSLREYLATGDIRKFGANSEIVEKARDSLRAKVKGDV